MTTTADCEVNSVGLGEFDEGETSSDVVGYATIPFTRNISIPAHTVVRYSITYRVSLGKIAPPFNAGSIIR